MKILKLFDTREKAVVKFKEEVKQLENCGFFTTIIVKERSMCIEAYVCPSYCLRIEYGCLSNREDSFKYSGISVHKVIFDESSDFTDNMLDWGLTKERL
jgi:hypothetical protein